MKRLYWLVFLSGLISLGATSQVIDNGVQTQPATSTPCQNYNPCLRDTYNVVWDNWCPFNCPDFPVSYRSKKYESDSEKVEYIMLSRPETTEQVPCGGVK